MHEPRIKETSELKYIGSHTVPELLKKLSLLLMSCDVIIKSSNRYVGKSRHYSSYLNKLTIKTLSAHVNALLHLPAPPYLHLPSFSLSNTTPKHVYL